MKHPKIEIIAVGSELLSPRFQDTNSLYLTERFNALGLEVSFKSIVGDDWDDLCLSIRNAIDRAYIIITVGGLGPTEDDRTKEAFASVLSRKLIFDNDLLQTIEGRFRRRGLSMPVVNKKQAYVIEGSETLENRNGTAPGIWMETDSNIIAILPGPPQELKPMFESSVWPHLQKFRQVFSARRVLKIAGLTESKIESLISDVYPKDRDLRLTTLAYPGQIEIHLTSRSRDSLEQAERKINSLKESLAHKLGWNIFSATGQNLEEVVGELLSQKKASLAVAESCTGGYLGHRITNVPGSSAYFLLGIVAYSNSQKNLQLGVPQDLIETHGAVSAEVAKAMASGVRKKAETDYGLAITGVAGPGGGTEEKPVGLVYTALAGETHLEVKRNIFLGEREFVKFQSSQKALDMLRRYLLKSQ
ncbi:MAG: competence/damage-inducible protein A [Candidatus Aminicenantes bacterium]